MKLIRDGWRIILEENVSTAAGTRTATYDQSMNRMVYNSLVKVQIGVVL